MLFKNKINLMTEQILNNLTLSSISIAALIYTVWIIHFLIRDSSIIDLIWGAGFGLVTIVLWWNIPVKTDYLHFLAIFPLVWVLRYTVFIFRRNFGNGEDDRYTKLRQNAKDINRSWVLHSFGVYTFQAVSMLIVSAPLIIGFAAPKSVQIGLIPIIGALIWIVGFLFETIADIQLNAFKEANKNYSGDYENKPLLTTGLWKYSRHPNYFGNACMWWGIALIASVAPYGYIGFLGSAYMTYALVNITGKANNESKMIKRKAYREYIERTSGFVPMLSREVDN